jgi:Peptidase family M1 domain
MVSSNVSHSRMLPLLAPALLLGALTLPDETSAQSRPAPSVDTAGLAASRRPIPGATYESPAFTRAVQRGTRTRTGMPGPRAWMPRARYTIDATLDDRTHTVRGEERVVYVNASGDTLAQLVVHVRQNAFRPESERNAPTTLSSGMQLSRVTIGEAAMRALPAERRPAAGTVGYLVDGTVMRVLLPAPLLPGDSVTLGVAWQYVPPLTPSDGRQGRDSSLYLMGYWYPQIAVHDDVEGWVADQYLIRAEFYMDPADYDVTVHVPRGWVVGSSGTLTNGDAILSAAARERLERARLDGGVVTISRPGDGGAAFAAAREAGATTAWHFTATGLRDFAWGTSDRYAWDATRAIVGADTVAIHSFYRETAPAAAWAVGGARFTRDAIERMSAYLWPYPWPTMTSMEGVLTSGGMEYPRMTFMQPWADTLSLAGDLMHETGHMWFPMQVGSNETRSPWMDEGLTQFDAAQAMRALYGEPRAGGRPNDQEPGQRRAYLARAASGDDQLLSTPGDLFPAGLYNTMYYNKTAQVLAALRGLLGEPTFHRALREYGRRWTGRHPYPADFFNTVSDVSGRELGWFWTTWFAEPWPLDQAIGRVRRAGAALEVTIEDRGLAPMPVMLAVTRANGRVERVEVPVDVWLAGARRYVVRVPRGSEVTRLEIDPEALFPDVDRANQSWARR